jgi:predicted nucleic acid-binding protein
VRVYLDVSCLNRPFDDQSQLRIRREAEAIRLILRQCRLGVLEQVSSDIATFEIDATPDALRRRRVRLLMPAKDAILTLTEPVLARATYLERLGIKKADALHVAAAEALDAAVLLSCDDRLCRLALRQSGMIKVRVVNPLDLMKEIGHGT